MSDLYWQNQRQLLKDAEALASDGKEFSHLCITMNQETRLRLRLFVQSLPNDIARQTIYGRAVTNEEQPKPKKIIEPKVKGDKKQNKK